MSWTVVRFSHQMAGVIVTNAEEHGFECYLPTVVETSVVRGRRVEKATSLFGSYMFVRLAEQWKNLSSVRGIQGIIMSSPELPAKIDDRVIDEIKSRINTRGRYSDPQRPRARAVKRLEVGDDCIASTGPVAGNIGIYQGATTRRREAALFMFLGRLSRFEFNVGSLSHAAL